MEHSLGEVLVVGGRTTGLMMASELARRGIPVRIVDASPGIDPHCRGNLLHSRTLEIFQGLGLAQAVIEGSLAEYGVRLYVGGEFVGESLHEAVDSPFPYGMSQSQARTESVLEAHLGSFGVAVERNVRLSGLAEEGDRVAATLTHADGREELFETPWLIGCDGAHSTVRHLTGTAFPGDADPYPYVLADVRVEGELDDRVSYLFLHEQGELFLFLPLPSRHRLVVANLPAGHEPSDPPTLEMVQALVRERALPRLKLSAPDWLAHFHIHYRLAPHYRHGRTFLAGDAAHVHSLLGGQGMNTGIQDAFNLAWKLALVMRGIAPEWWLDTYESERRRVAADVVATTRAATEQAELFANVSAAERERIVAHMFVPEPQRLEAARHLQEVGLDYRSSPLSLEPGGWTGGPRAGAEAPQASPIVVDGKTRTYLELAAGTSHRLLIFNGPAAAELDAGLAALARGIRREHGDWIDVAVVVAGPTTPELWSSRPGELGSIGDPTGSMHRKFGADAPCLYLIRPDGYVAYRSRQTDGLDAYLGRLR